jgi:hypothetical protein
MPQRSGSLKVACRVFRGLSHVYANGKYTRSRIQLRPVSSTYDSLPLFIAEQHDRAARAPEACATVITAWTPPSYYNGIYLVGNAGATRFIPRDRDRESARWEGGGFFDPCNSGFSRALVASAVFGHMYQLLRISRYASSVKSDPNTTGLVRRHPGHKTIG